ncbi:hypothetical protein ACJEBI_19430 [Bacillus salipaludis]|uniref:Transposase n=1 Tax=Bacillus salipaludis TaxID=2547811 RepID=A0ABW8RM66_9BACI
MVKRGPLCPSKGKKAGNGYEPEFIATMEIKISWYDAIIIY